MNTENLQGNEPKKFDPGTDKRIHEILNNESDSVSEEDINNIRTDVGNQGENSTSGIEDIKDDEDPEIDNTSWNVLEGDN